MGSANVLDAGSADVFGVGPVGLPVVNSAGVFGVDSVTLGMVSVSMACVYTAPATSYGLIHVERESGQ